MLLSVYQSALRLVITAHVHDVLVAERFSARQLILHRISPSVCMCVCVCPVTLQECNYLTYVRAQVHLHGAWPYEQIERLHRRASVSVQVHNASCASDIQHELPQRHFVRLSTGPTLTDTTCLMHNTGLVYRSAPSPATSASLATAFRV